MAEGFVWQEVVKDVHPAALVSVLGEVVDSGHQTFSWQEEVGWQLARS